MSDLPILASLQACTGCMACIDICPKHALKPRMHEDGHFYVTLNQDNCIKCLKCEKVCKDSRSNYGCNDLSLSTPYAAWARKKEYRKAGTSGGVFAAIAEWILSEGGIVIGAKLNTNSCSHTVISQIEDIQSLQGSKYMQSNTEGIYRQIAAHLKNRKVLFTGLGCQVSAVIAFFNTHPHKENLYTADLVCGGVPSSLLINQYIINNPNIEKISSFRTKSVYELKGWINAKEVCLKNRPLPLYGFFFGMTNRYSCSNCQHAFTHRKSDFTLGDLWQDEDFPDEHKNGISLLICHNEKAKHIMLASDIEYSETKWEKVLPANQRIANGKRKIYWQRKYISSLFKLLSYRQINKLYALSIKPYDLIWFAYKVILYTKLKLEKRQSTQLIKKILEQ